MHKNYNIISYIIYTYLHTSIESTEWDFKSTIYWIFLCCMSVYHLIYGIPENKYIYIYCPTLIVTLQSWVLHSNCPICKSCIGTRFHFLWKHIKIKMFNCWYNNSSKFLQIHFCVSLSNFPPPLKKRRMWSILF